MGKFLSKLHKKLSATIEQHPLATARHSGPAFPFPQLPQVCKLHVLSFLDPVDKVSASRVCTEWHELLRAPMLWKNVDVPACVEHCAAVQQCSSVQQSARQHLPSYPARCKKFLRFVCELNPSVDRFVFEGDIIDSDYLNMLDQFLDGSRLNDLRHVNINWCPASESSHQASDDNHRRRQRLFVRLFDKLTCLAPNICSLTIPFDWSPKSVEALCRLRNIKTLTLSRYSEFQSLDESALDRVLRGLPRLRRLVLEVWTACAAGGLSFYSLESASLEVLDVSQCRGLAVSARLSLPRLRSLRVSRQPWSGPLSVRQDASASAGPSVVCLHKALSTGCPQLTSINGHALECDWRDCVSDALNDVLKSVCACSLHSNCSSAAPDTVLCL